MAVEGTQEKGIVRRDPRIGHLKRLAVQFFDVHVAALLRGTPLVGWETLIRILCLRGKGLWEVKPALAVLHAAAAGIKGTARTV